MDFKPDYGPATVCGHGRIEGHNVGFVSNNGPIDPAGATKAAQFIQLCNQSGTPIVYLQNTTGFIVGRASEEAGMIKHGSKMIQALANSRVPQVTIYCGASFGAGNYGMCGRAFHPRFCFSWPNARTAVMGGEQAATTLEIVARQQADRKGQPVDDARLAAQKQEIVAGFERQASAFYTSGHLLDDGVIDPGDTRAVLAFVLATAREVVENYKVGSLARYGLDEASIRKRRPDIIYCSVTGFGQSGPYAARPAYDFILQGLAGVTSTFGQPEGAPGAGAMRTAIPITDVVTGLYAAIGVVSALYHRRQTGQGQHVDAAMLDASVALNGHLALGYLMTGKVPPRVGNTNPIASPSEVFACADGELIVAAGNNGQFQAMCRVLGQLQWAEDERFRTNALRVSNRAALRDAVVPVLAGRRRAELLAAFEEAGVPCGPINDMADVFEDPQTRHRELELRLPHSRGVEVPSLRSPLRFSDTPVAHRASPMLGEHSAKVLAVELGIDEKRLQALRDGAII
jgi:crotonobetainyl-CoA:carnitine CoA-transferase CaiB-like acyl-CoA transferase